MKKVLFICNHNSARSQMAEALLKQMCGEFFEVASAGMKPGTLNPLAVQVMAEVGIDISQNKTKDLFPFIRERPGYNYVISVCDKSTGQHCPTFPAPCFGGFRLTEIGQVNISHPGEPVFKIPYALTVADEDEFMHCVCENGASRTGIAELLSAVANLAA